MDKFLRIATAQACLFCAIVFIVCLAVLTGADGSNVLDLQQDLDCEMVELSTSTKGELGWPDFNNSYIKECTSK